MIYVRNFKYIFLNKFGDMKIWISILIEKKYICILKCFLCFKVLIKWDFVGKCVGNKICWWIDCLVLRNYRFCFIKLGKYELNLINIYFEIYGVFYFKNVYMCIKL